MRCFSSSLNASRCAAERKYPPRSPQLVIRFTTRSISPPMFDSRSGLSGAPRKYIDATMFTACWDHAVGVLTSRCSKTASPVLFVISAVRWSHSMRSYGSSPAIVKYRGTSIPGPPAARAFSPRWFMSTDMLSLPS